MASTTPNKETIRRLCLLHKVSYCYILVDTGTAFVELLSDIKDSNKLLFKGELESWCGMSFQTYNLHSNCNNISRLKKEGEKIYPLDNKSKT
jgi:hypothetical protein